jgi:hypothetical protein
MLDTTRSGPSKSQRRRFFEFRRHHDAILPRIRAMLDRDHSAAPDDWWIVYVDLLGPESPANEIELTCESRSTSALRAILLRGDFSQPATLEVVETLE